MESFSNDAVNEATQPASPPAEAIDNLTIIFDAIKQEIEAAHPSKRLICFVHLAEKYASNQLIGDACGGRERSSISQLLRKPVSDELRAEIESMRERLPYPLPAKKIQKPRPASKGASANDEPSRPEIKSLIAIEQIADYIASNGPDPIMCIGMVQHPLRESGPRWKAQQLIIYLANRLGYTDDAIIDYFRRDTPKIITNEKLRKLVTATVKDLTALARQDRDFAADMKGHIQNLKEQAIVPACNNICSLS